MTPITAPGPSELPPIHGPSVEEVQKARGAMAQWIVQTPVVQGHSKELTHWLGPKAQVFFKMELWQHGGSFKPRGALTTILNLSEDKKNRGVVAVSAGNHAIAVSYAAKMLGVDAKVLMPKTASIARIETCQAYGAKIKLCDDIPHCFELVKVVAEEEGRTLIHPFEGPYVALGTGTLGLELCEQIPDMDAVVVAVGGGGLCAGMGNVIKQLQPQCKVYGVEPEGANNMSLSFKAGKPKAVKRLRTIADSLSAPASMPYSYSLASQSVDEIATVTDDEMREAMGYFFSEFKMAVEPACAAALAGLKGELRQELQNQRVAVILCGSNTDLDTYYRYMRPTVD